MKRTLLISSLAAILVATIGLATNASAKGPTAGVVLTDQLDSPRGMKIGADGMIYVAEAGHGGSTTMTIDGGEHHVGTTGRISKVDPETGARTTVADGLPSDAGPMGDSVGPADVAFLGGQLYYVQTHSGAAYGSPDHPTGVYRVNDDGSTDLVADIYAFNVANPTEAITDGSQPDVETGGNPYAMIARDGAFWVTDGNHNHLMKVTTDGEITAIAEFPNHPVNTGIAAQATGPLYVATLGRAPFFPEDGRVVRVGVPSGAQVDIASGISMATDVEFGPGGQMYALSFAVFAPSPNSPSPFAMGSGSIYRVDTATGTLTKLVTGFDSATFLIFDGDTAYVANNGVTIPGIAPGQIVKIENFSAIQPLPAPAPTAAAPAPVATPTRTGIVAPDTGSGPEGDDGGLWVIVAFAIGAAGVAATGGAFALKRG